MNIVFRADASFEIGTGHIMRCLTLGDKFRSTQNNVLFICGNRKGNLFDFIESNGFQTYQLSSSVATYSNQEQAMYGQQNCKADWEEDAKQTTHVLKSLAKVDWLIVDNYTLDIRWEKYLRPTVENIMVIDDLADRKHDCDLLLDQNLYPDMERRYDGLTSPNCVKLIGPRYAVLRKEFVEARKFIRKRDGIVKRMLVFFGGSDPTNETMKALESIQILNLSGIAVDVVVGATNPEQENVRKLCEKINNTRFYCQINNMAELLQKADIVIGAGGTSSWERCCMGVPALVIAVADNQVDIAKALHAAGAALYLGTSGSVTVSSLADVLWSVLNNRKQLLDLSEAALHLVDGNGVDRVLSKIGQEKS